MRESWPRADSPSIDVPLNIRTAEAMASARNLADAFPEHSLSVIELVISLAGTSRVPEAIDVARQAVSRSPHILQRIRLRDISRICY